MPATLFDLYGCLRARLLARHFALGRQFRADELSFSNFLGVVHQHGSTSPGDQNDLVHGLLNTDAQIVEPPNDDTAHILALPKDQALFERWRVADHSRTNPLMYSGQLMTCLAVEAVLGVPGSKDILARLLNTMASLFKYSDSPNDGYILRWDPVTSDHWPTFLGEGGIWVDSCGDFLVDSSRTGGYLYTTPLDDPRYVPYMRQTDFDNLTTTQQIAYQNARLLSLDRLRYWEPSTDELVGLLAGYSFVVQTVNDASIRAQVTSQVQKIGGYLAANAYFLVRPEGGFVSQGGSGFAPATEFPFGRIFSRITGSAFTAQTNFEGALQNANLWSVFSSGFFWAGVAGVITAVIALILLWPVALTLGAVFGALFGTLFAGLSSTALLRALVVNANQEAFDVRAWPGLKNSNDPSGVGQRKNDQQSEFVLGYLLSQVPKKLRFTASLFALGHFGIGKYAQNFPPFLGLSAIGDTDTTVASAYLDWFNAQGGNTQPPPAYPPPNFDDVTSATTPVPADPFATAVAVNLGAGVPAQTNLMALLTALQSEFDNSRADELAMFDDNSPYDGSSYVTEPVRPTLDFLAAVALAWLFAKTQTDAALPLPAGFPMPPPPGSALPPATIPPDVINGTMSWPTAPQVIPLDALGPLPNPVTAPIDLFGPGAPGKPANPPVPLTQVHWLDSAAVSHSGLFGSRGNDTLNAGRMLSGTGARILGVRLELIDRHGVPLGTPGTTTSLGRADAVDGSWPFTAGARIESDGTGSADETVTVHWWYDTGRACRYRLGYLAQGAGAAL